MSKIGVVTGLLKCVGAMEDSTVRKATFFVSTDHTIKLTRRHKDRKNSRQKEWVLTVGKPNYAEREFIKKCKKVGEPFPVKKIQLKFFPSK